MQSDSCNSELSFNSEPAGSPSSSVKVQPRDTSVVHPSAANPKPKRIRKGRKTELLELRAQVATYKSKLNTLVRRKHDKSASHNGNFWQRSAHRIALEERLAFRENARLRSLTERQLSTIKALQQLILDIESSNVRAFVCMKRDLVRLLYTLCHNAAAHSTCVSG